VLARWVTKKSPGRNAFAAVAAYAASCAAMALYARHSAVDLTYILSLPWNGLLVSSLIFMAASALSYLPLFNANRLPLRLIGLASYPFFLAHGILIRSI
jgi:hypothetical protein